MRNKMPQGTLAGATRRNIANLPDGMMCSRKSGSVQFNRVQCSELKLRHPGAKKNEINSDQAGGIVPAALLRGHYCRRTLKRRVGVQRIRASQRKRKSAALIRRALDPDATVVQLDDCLGDRESDAQSVFAGK